MWNKCLLAYWKVLKLVLDKNGPSVQTLCLDALPFSLVHSLLLKLGRNSLASPLPFWKCVESRMLGICLYYFKVLQFITCPSITKSFSYMYWMEKKIIASTLRGKFSETILTGTTNWRPQKMLSMLFVTWRLNKAVRLISNYFEVLNYINAVSQLFHSNRVRTLKGKMSQGHFSCYWAQQLCGPCSIPISVQ